MMIRDATAKDIEGRNYEASLNGIVVDHDGEIFAIAGVMHTQPLQAFSSILDDRLRKSPKTIVKMGKRFIDILDSYDDPIYAIASQAENRPDSFLKHLGFQFLGESPIGNVYSWNI